MNIFFLFTFLCLAVACYALPPFGNVGNKKFDPFRFPSRRSVDNLLPLRYGKRSVDNQFFLMNKRSVESQAFDTLKNLVRGKRSARVKYNLNVHSEPIFD